MSAQTDLWTLATIVGLAAITVLTRCFFFIMDRPWTLPAWAHRALKYAPVAALAGVIAPEVVMSSGQFIHTWQDARLYAAPVGALLYFWRRSVLLTIAAGMAVYLPLHLLLGW
ncbi:AzlD domain-containing protein [Caenimonas aquaedulcis]|uniref:AzlD domain-containing protein n=1 Tax=Caenimonas aquaedulcis TaxID=2793270 RepID=A0A931MI41_9BURK|nr:AzlD domain-containing protein [Caenimonas aquaedulcis]MBG9388835.1 AzlD domain-containing protein [Caenimonas aquaedulcis]